MSGGPMSCGLKSDGLMSGGLKSYDHMTHICQAAVAVHRVKRVDILTRCAIERVFAVLCFSARYICAESYLAVEINLSLP